MKWLKRRQRDRRGVVLQYLVPEMLKYVADRYEPLIQYCIVPEDKPAPAPKPEERKPVPPEKPEKPAEQAGTGASSGSISYSITMPLQPVELPPEPGDSRKQKIKYSLSIGDEINAAIQDMGKFAKEAEKDMALYDSPALEKTYHAWERKNAEYKSFSSEVVRMVKEKYRKTSDFYHAAGIDKRTYHKISTDFGYKPARVTAFRCCIGLKLNAEEAEELLKLAGMAFSPNDPDDLVLKFCLENGIRDIPGINYMLYKYATREQDK